MDIPLKDKLTWSIKEASQMSGIGEGTLRKIVSAHNPDWVFRIDTHMRIKAAKFKDWVEGVVNINTLDETIEETIKKTNI